jgi:hypothetical protein
MKIRPVGAQLFYADRQTDMPTLTVAFRNFVNAPKKMALRHHVRAFNIKFRPVVHWKIWTDFS